MRDSRMAHERVSVTGEECEVVLDGDGVWVKNGYLPVWEKIQSARVVNGVHDKEMKDGA